MSDTLDRRLHAFRADLADERLRGRVEAQQFTKGTPAQVVIPVADLRPRPDAGCGIDTQLLLGEQVTVFDRRDGFAWVQNVTDGYVGYLREGDLGELVAATHRICVPRTFVYPDAELRKVPVRALSMGSGVRVVGEAETRGTRYFMLEGGGAVIARHCLPIDERAGNDYVAIASLFLETPYLWGGRSGFGIDCSGLVQLSAMMTGRAVPRDSDQQAAFGTAIDRQDLRRGDLVFWAGHVAIMEDAAIMLHASGHTMTVTREPLDDAIERIGALYGAPNGYRRFF